MRTSTRDPLVVVVGGLNQDVVVRAARRPGGGETVVGDGPLVTAGGKGANSAVAAARAGARVAMCGAVGDDAAGRAQVEALQDAGVDVRAVAVRPGPTGVALVVVTPDGENAIVVGRGANDALTADDVGDACTGATVVLAQCEVGPVPVEAAGAAALADASTRLVLGLAPVLDLDPATLALADPLVLNESEAAEALGHPAVPVAALAEELVARTGCRSAVVTLGPGGAAYARAGGAGHVDAPVVPAGEVRDTTGAGDVLTGVLAARLALGDDLPLALRTACSAAAESVRHPGARGVG